MSLQGVCLSSRGFCRGGFVGGFCRGPFCPEGFLRGGFCSLPLLSEYNHYNRKLNTVFNFSFHMYAKQLSHLLFSDPSSSSVTYMYAHVHVGLLYGRLLTVLEAST